VNRLILAVALLGACAPTYEPPGRCIESSVAESPRLWRPCTTVTLDVCRYSLFEDEYEADVAFTQTCRQCLQGHYSPAYVAQVCEQYER
jgi:hypothetical protein